MEHRLILGGEQYLPFARSCVTKLKKLGLPYANQSFEIDGVSIKVRIEPGHEYIRIAGDKAVYLESGQLEWTFPSEMNPEKYDPAKWRFLDIPTTNKYLGWVDAKNAKSVGKQKNDPDLSEGMNSQAIGFPTRSGLTAEKIAEVKAAYGNNTVMRKLVAAFFPPSLFSGKMRLFMQAKYGALAEKNYSPFTVIISGLSVLLYYVDRSGKTMQFGFWDHNSPGIYTSPEGKYWLVHFRATAVGDFVATAYPITMPPSAASLKTRLKEEDISDLERSQCEAYILGMADIQLNKGEVIGTVSGAEGFAISYGWKFSRSGKKASVALIQAFDDGDGFDKYYKARTVHCIISSTVSEDGLTTLSLTSTIDQHGDWNYDTWAEYNIFVPEKEENVGSLFCISREQPSRMREEFNFSNVTIYGYYVGETWTPVKISRKIPPGPWPKFKNKFGPGFYSDSTAEALATLPQAYQYGVVIGGSTFNYEEHEISSSRVMDLVVGEQLFKGTSEYGLHRYYVRYGTGTLDDNAVNYPGITLDGAPPSGLNPPGYPAGGITGIFEGAVAKLNVGTITMETRTFTGAISDLWVLVIPGQDCESVIVPSHHYSSADTLTLQVSTGSGVTHFSGHSVNGGIPDALGVYPSPGIPYSYAPWVGASSLGGWYGIPPGLVTTTGTEPIAPGEFHVSNFSPSVPGSEGTPSGSYYTLFNVDSGNPYYNGVMYFINSYGGRYAASEYASSPPSVSYQRPFVGWA